MLHLQTNYRSTPSILTVGTALLGEAPACAPRLRNDCSRRQWQTQQWP